MKPTKQLVINNQKGFTLLEILVVIAIITVVGTMSTQIFLGLIRSSNKTNIQNEVRQNGSFVVDRMERDIRGSTGATLTGSTQLNLTQPDGTAVTYLCTVGTSSSNGGITRDDSVTSSGQQLLNVTSATTGVKVSACTFALQGASPVLVQIDFTLTQAYNSPVRTDLTVTQPFTTRVALRSY
jgi:prepilin-type N-terminal cleavage/methylation domain-containing protein